MSFQNFHQAFITKTVIIQHEPSEKTAIFHSLIDVTSEFMDFLEVLSMNINNIQTKYMRAYDFRKNSYVEINSEHCRVPSSFLANNQNNIVLIKFKDQEQTSIDGTDNVLSHQDKLEIKSQTSTFKKQRSKERVIFEVIEIVKRWRQIHLSPNALKKISLQEAAKIVGLPKKSLDDYYYQLRLGEKFNFDFKSHLFDRIGVLRTYIKKLGDQHKIDKSQKHPKKLKILDQFNEIESFVRRQNLKTKDNTDEMCMDEQDVCSIKDEVIDNEDFISDQANKRIRLQFYNDFSFGLTQKDPFLMMDYDFKKKTYEQEDNFEDQLYF